MIISDESTIKQDKYHNIMAAHIEKPSNIFLLKVNYLTKNIDGDVVHDDILSCIREYDFKIDNFTLLITDAASYMKRGADMLKEKIPNMFHIFCIAHIIHNCALRIKT